MASRQVVVRIQVCGELVTGFWCSPCALPSGVGIVVLIANQPKVATVCTECGHRV